MDSDDQSQATATVTSSFSMDIFGDVTDPTVEQEETTQVETTGAVSVAHSSESSTRKEILPIKSEDAEPNVSALHGCSDIYSACMTIETSISIHTGPQEY